MRITTVIALAAVGPASAFNLPGLTDIFKPPSMGSAPKTSLANEEAQLLAAITNTGNGKDADLPTQSRVLSIVRKMETSAPPRDTLLSNPEEAKLIDGDWYLQYTAPSEIEGYDDENWVAVDAAEGESNIETRQFGKAGTVSSGGIPVDASATPALQSFDISNSRVKNEVKTGFGTVTVGGTFRQSTKVPLRAIVAFDIAKVAFNVGLTIDLGFLLNLRAALKNGNKEAGWVETTYLSNDMRIGRGNKGSLFVLTRDRDAVEA